ncbi:hypothetical protein FRC00_001629 [Tulasnella sp. 408]|nr:hypothetical protein FRC00_001629 [Tulasnella sp. 408]
MSYSNGVLIDNQDAVLSNFETARFVEDSIPPLEPATTDWPEASKRYTSPEIFGEEVAARTLASDIWAWACTVFEILTNRTPYPDAKGDIRFYQAINQGKLPGDRDLLLRLASEACKPDCAAGLRFLHSYIRLCWDFDPQKRPQISTFRQQLSDICARDASRDGLKLTLDELAYLLVQPHRITIIEGSDLGAGNYGDVVLAKLDESLPTSRDVAVKQLRAVGTRGDRIRLVKNAECGSTLGQRLARELNIWAKIKHPNVVELIGYYLDEKFEVPQLISAFMVNGNVLKYIRCAKPSTARRVQFENVLINDNLTAVLCDFGLASFACGTGPVGLTTRTGGIKGTKQYMSPELHQEDDVKHTLESDVWAWGCTAFEIITERIPYASAKGNLAFYRAIDSQVPPGDVGLLLSEVTPSTPAGCVAALEFLHSSIQSSWSFEPSARPSASLLLQNLSEFSLAPS